MKYDFDDLYEGPRFQNKARKRKIRLIISSIMAIIGFFIIIGIVSFFSTSKEEANGSPEETMEATKPVDDDEDTINGSEKEESSDNQESLEDEAASQDHSSNTGGINKNNSDRPAVIDEEADPVRSNSGKVNESQVIGTIEKNWEAVGTEQQGEHVTDFTKGSQDWQEMTKAVSSATGLADNNMIVWWMGNGGAPNKAVSTVSTKDKASYYRVQLEWVDNAGWKPVKVEQIEGNDHQPTTNATSDNIGDETNN